MQELIKSLEEWADWVIIDSPPLLAVADGAAVARWVDGVLMVSKGAESTRDAARKAREMLDQVGARVAGVVVWGLEGGAGGGGYGYGKYGGYYYYSDYYANVPSDGKRSSGSSKSRPAKAAEAPAGSTPVSSVYIPPVSPGRRFLQTFGRIVMGVLVAVAIVAIIVLVVYFVDQAMGWGIVVTLGILQ